MSMHTRMAIPNQALQHKIEGQVYICTMVSENLTSVFEDSNNEQVCLKLTI
jgi:hypothetical protein